MGVIDTGPDCSWWFRVLAGKLRSETSPPADPQVQLEVELQPHGNQNILHISGLNFRHTFIHYTAMQTVNFLHIIIHSHTKILDAAFAHKGAVPGVLSAGVMLP